MGDIYTVKQMAAKLQIHEVTAYLLIEQEKIKCIRIGRNIRIPEKYLMEFIEQGGVVEI